MNNYVYTIGNKIYINLTNQCSNNCKFCIRNSTTQTTITDDLWLEEEPCGDDIIEQLPLDLDNYDDEVVFCGYGEPTYNLEALEEVASYLHCIDKTTRINTNGQGTLIAGDDAVQLVCDCCDTVSISLNASTATKYDNLCKSKYGARAFDAVIEFAKRCKSRGANVVMTVVDCIDVGEIEKCKKLCQNLKLPLRVRPQE